MSKYWISNTDFENKRFIFLKIMLSNIYPLTLNLKILEIMPPWNFWHPLSRHLSSNPKSENYGNYVPWNFWHPLSYEKHESEQNYQNSEHFPAISLHHGWLCQIHTNKCYQQNTYHTDFQERWSSTPLQQSVQVLRSETENPCKPWNPTRSHSWGHH